MKTALAVVLAVLLAGPAAAQSVNCAAQWASLVDMLGRTAGMKPPAPGIFRQTADRGCRTDGLEFAADRHLAIKANRLTWTGRDMERFVQDGLPPTAFELTLSGIRFVPQVGDKTFEYLHDIQARGQSIEVSLSVNWDDVENVVTVDNLLISLTGGDFIKFDSRVEGVDLTNAESLAQSAGQFGLTEMNLEIRSKRMFQNYLLLPLGMALLDAHPDPAARMAELKAMGRHAIDTAPNDWIAPRSKAALKSLLDDLPDPAGTLRIRQTATPGIGVARALAFSLRAGSVRTVEDLWPFFDGITTEISYERF